MRNESGQSLVTVMVALAITGVLMMAVTQLADQQNKSMKLYSQKSDMLQLKNFISQQLNQTSICEYTFSTVASAAINTVTPSATPDIVFPRLRSGANANAPIMVSTVAGEPGNILSGAKVTSIKMTNFSGGGLNQYTGELVVSFDPTTTVQVLKPIKIPLSVVADMTSSAPATAKPISTCFNGSAVNFFATQVLTQPAPPAHGVVASTATNDYVWTYPGSVESGAYSIAIHATVQPKRCDGCWNPAWYGVTVNGSTPMYMSAGADDEDEAQSLKALNFIFNISIAATGPYANRIEVRFLGGTTMGQYSIGLWDLSVEAAKKGP